MAAPEEFEIAMTVEEIVALAINMDYMPPGISLLEMTEAYKEEAEVNYENALRDDIPSGQLEELELRNEFCRSRHNIAQSFKALLEYEVENLSNSRKKNSDAFGLELVGNSTPPRLSYFSVMDWASFKFGIKMPGEPLTKLRHLLKKPSWEDITIKIYKNYRIGLQIKNGKFINSSFQKIGLMGGNKHEPNYPGGILIGLSMDKKYPHGNNPQPKDKTAISKLRNSLVTLVKSTGLRDDPFKTINDTDGWKPRFKLIDDRRNADERAKGKATHVSYDESNDYGGSQTDDFEREDDPAQDFIGR